MGIFQRIFDCICAIGTVGLSALVSVEVVQQSSALVISPFAAGLGGFAIGIFLGIVTSAAVVYFCETNDLEDTWGKITAFEISDLSSPGKLIRFIYNIATFLVQVVTQPCKLVLSFLLSAMKKVYNTMGLVIDTMKHLDLNSYASMGSRILGTD